MIKLIKSIHSNIQKTRIDMIFFILIIKQIIFASPWLNRINSPTLLGLKKSMFKKGWIRRKFLGPGLDPNPNPRIFKTRSGSQFQNEDPIHWIILTSVAMRSTTFSDGGTFSLNNSLSTEYFLKCIYTNVFVRSIIEHMSTLKSIINFLHNIFVLKKLPTSAFVAPKILNLLP